MALRKVKSNLDRLFDKNLTDLIRGIRNNKDNEARYIASCTEEIKAELRDKSIYVKANAVEKLCYLQMLGYDISWASFNIIEVMASTKFGEKRIGYLAATQAFNDDTVLLIMTTNMIRKDLQSSNLYDVGVALSGLACFTTPDIARDLIHDVVNLLSSSRPYVRKKAVLLLYKMFLKYPESLRPTFSRLKDKLEDPDPGVQSAAVNVICELARKNPKNYLSLAPVFFKLMNTSSNNWMLIKIIKLFGSLVPLEARLGKKLLDPLTNIINSTSAMSLLYECINTVIAVLMSISSEFPNGFTASIQLCVQKLGVLIDDSDQNLKYLGLLAMGKILKTHPKAVQAHKDIVMRCLDDKDESIRLRALDLLYGMVSKKNIMEIVKKLMKHVDEAEGSYYRDELLSRIIGICSHNNYQYITDFEWYISVLVEMTKVEGSKHGVKIAEQIQDVTVRVQSIRHFSVSQMALLVENAHLLLSNNGNQRHNLYEVLLAAAWICGEYSEHVRNIPLALESMLKTKMSVVPGKLLSVYVQNIAKLYSVLLLKYENEDDWDAVETLDNLMLSKLPEFQYTDHLEAQERACNFVEILNFIEEKHTERVKMGEHFAALFEGELNPVASKAQKKVPVPEGLNLNEYINQPEPETESESSESEFESSSAFPKMQGQHPIYQSESPTHTVKKQRNEVELQLEIDELRRKRQKEIESNPYYVKTDKKTPLPQKNLQKGIDRSESLLTNISELQSPLEIPGVIGMDKYLKQQSSTMTWKTAKEEMESKKKKKGKKVGKKLKRKKATSSSEEEDENAVIIHQVNRDDGEMPEGAKSTDEDDDINGIENEFKALDMDLDEPLREDEQLMKPITYKRPEEETFSSYLPKTEVLVENKNVKKIENGKKKKKAKKIKEKSSKDKSRKSSEKETKKKKSEKLIEDTYTSLESTAKPSKSSVKEIIPEKSTVNGFGKGEITSLKAESLAENNDLRLVGKIKIFNGVDALLDNEGIKAIASIKMKNRGSDTIRRLEMSVFETENAKLDTSAGITDSASIMLPFELTSNSINEHNLHFIFKNVLVTQRIKVTLMYCLEKSDGQKTEEKISFILTFPAINFLIYATIGSTSYELILSNDEFSGVSSEKTTSKQLLETVIDDITSQTNFSVVEKSDDAVSLYAHAFDDSPVCVLLKKQMDKYSISVKCAIITLSHSIAQDLKQIISKEES